MPCSGVHSRATGTGDGVGGGMVMVGEGRGLGDAWDSSRLIGTMVGVGDAGPSAEQALNRMSRLRDKRVEHSRYITN